MTTVLDAFAVIALLAGEPAGREVGDVLRTPGADVRLTAVNLAEVVDRLVRGAGLAPATIDERLALLAAGGLRVTPVTEPTGRLAGALRGRHCRRGPAALSLADCVALAATLEADGALATADAALARAARAEGAQVLALPDSRGVRR